MTTADLVRFFARRRKIPFRAALALAESVTIRRTLKPDKPSGTDRAQLRIPFSDSATRPAL